MVKTDTIILKEGQSCSIDCGTHGMSLEGPITLVVIKETAAGATESVEEKQQNRYC